MPFAARGSSTNSCLNVGITRFALAPRHDGSTGTSRQPRTRRFSSTTIRSIESIAFSQSDPSDGRNAIPTAYAPTSGSVIPAVARRNASGICTRMPAPSPVSGSAPVAPRCSMLHSAPSAVETMPWLARPLMSTTNDTPQASCSNRGSYRPRAGGRKDCIVVLRTECDPRRLSRTRDDVGPIATG